MNTFLKVSIKAKNIPPQGMTPHEINLSSDAILVYRLSRNGIYDITLKPEYEAKVLSTVGMSPKSALEYIQAEEKEIKKLS